MRAIVLAGGFGTRIRSITGDEIPKCMAMGWFKFGTRELPWMEIIVRQLRTQGIKDITLSLHYKPQVFIDWFGDKLKYKIEPEPLGTGGAVKHCIEESDGDDPILVLNGDTYAKCDFYEMLSCHKSPLATVAKSKGITAGVYIINPSIFKDASKGKFCLDEFINMKPRRDYIIPYFTDMGTPEGYQKAQV